MKKISEGNLYNTEEEITHQYPDATEDGLENWREEVKKELMQKLISGNLKNIEPIITQVFGDSLE